MKYILKHKHKKSQIKNLTHQDRFWGEKNGNIKTKFWVYAIYNGWYGDCEQESCESFDLIANKDNIFASYQFTENGVGSSSFSSVVANIAPSLNGFNELNCGKMYYIILSKGTSEIDIPNFVCNNDAMTNDLGKIVKTCQEIL